MPIRINLLAERQAQQEERRRDPVKRVAWVAGLVVGALVVWGGYLQLKLMALNGSVAENDAKYAQIEARYNQAQSNKTMVARAEQRLESLATLASSRVLWANCLNAMQFSTLPEIKLIQLQTRQSYVITPGTPPATNETGQITSIGTPAISREQTVVTLQARDSSSNPGKDLIREYQERLAEQPFFRTNLEKIRMVALGQLQRDLAPGSKPFVEFSLECSFADRER